MNPKTFLFAILVAVVVSISSMTTAFAASVSVNQDASRVNPLVCTVSGASGALVYKWFLGNDEQYGLVNQYEVSTSHLVRGDQWRCEVYTLIYNPLTYSTESIFQGSDSTTIRNVPPQIISTPIDMGSAGTPYSYDVEATDADGDALEYSLVSNILGMTINSSTGLIQWSNPTAGSHQINVSVTDHFDTVNQVYVLTVSGSGSSLTVTANAVPISGCRPLPVNFGATATGGSGYNFTWNFGDGSSGNGQSVTHTYQNPGNYNAIVSVVDSSSRTGFAQVSVNVTGVCLPLSVSINANPRNGTAPLLATFAAAISGGQAPYTYAWDTNGDGVFNDGNSATATRSFNSAGNYNVSVRVTDSSSTVTASIIYNVFAQAPDAPQFTTNSCLNGEVGKDYTCDINANSPVNFTLSNAPSGMTINRTTGVVSWNPSSAGTYDFTVRTTNAYGSNTRVFTVDIVDKETQSSNDLYVPSIIFDADEVQQGREIVAYVTVENEGDSDFEDLKIKMTIEDLGIEVSSDNFDLDNGDKETVVLRLDLPNRVDDGDYLVKFTVYNDDVKVTKYRQIYIKGVSSASAVSDSVVSTSTTTSVSSYQPSVGKAKLNWAGIWFVLILFLLLLALSIYMARKAMKKDEPIKIEALDNELI